VANDDGLGLARDFLGRDDATLTSRRPGDALEDDVSDDDVDSCVVEHILAALLSRTSSLLSDGLERHRSSLQWLQRLQRPTVDAKTEEQCEAELATEPQLGVFTQISCSHIQRARTKGNIVTINESRT